MNKDQRHEQIYIMLRVYGSMSIKTIIQKFEKYHNYKMIENQVFDFIKDYENLLHIETIKTKKRSKFLIGRQDMKGL